MYHFPELYNRGMTIDDEWPVSTRYFLVAVVCFVVGYTVALALPYPGFMLGAFPLPLGLITWVYARRQAVLPGVIVLGGAAIVVGRFMIHWQALGGHLG